jgi:hypothetical protein
MDKSSNNTFICGAVSGMISAFCCQPFDTLKIFYQQINSSQYKDFLALKKYTQKIKYLWRGSIPSMLGVGTEKALVFGTNNYVFNYFSLDRNNIYHNFLVGGISGIGALFAVVPCEYIKINMQNDMSLKMNSLINLSLLKQGILATSIRELPGFSVYFGTYYYLKSLINKQNTTLGTLICGSISGFTAWTVVYPADRIKTIVQGSKSKKTIRTAAYEIYKFGGFKNFYKGIGFGYARAIPLHAIVFLSYEWLQNK